MVLGAFTLALLVQGLVDGPTRGWTDLRTLAALVLAVGALVGFVVRERTAAAPMIPLGMLANPRFAAAVGANTLSTAAIFGATYLTSVYFQVARGYSPWETGLRFLPWTVTPLLIAPLGRPLTDRIGARRLAVPGLALQAAGFAWIVALTDGSHSYSALIAPMLIAGIGASLALPALPSRGAGRCRPRVPRRRRRHRQHRSAGRAGDRSRRGDGRVRCARQPGLVRCDCLRLSAGSIGGRAVVAPRLRRGLARRAAQGPRSVCCPPRYPVTSPHIEFCVAGGGD